MRTTWHASLLVLGMLSSIIANGGNPVIKEIGMSDPHVRVFNDTLYLFSGHDDSPGDTTWVMRDWRVFSSTDLINWKLETTISPENNYMGKGSTDCWAGDAAARNGKYYFYFSDRKRSIGVMEANLPGGPYTDVLGKPLVEPMHDPTIFMDQDKKKTPYIIYGDKEGGGYHIAELNDDMISLAEPSKPITIIGNEWEKAPGWMDKNYLLRHNDFYYLSWGRDYATSTNIYGPYQCAGAVGNGHHLDEFAHGSFFWWKGQFYHIWTYYLTQDFKYRECIITYCHIDDDGRIVTDTGFLDNHFSTGVGQYDASWPEIQAEWYSGKSEEIIKRGSRETGFRLGNIENGSWVKFANVDFSNKTKKLKFIASLDEISKKGTIEIRKDSLSGQLIGKAFINGKRKNAGESTVSCKLKKINGMNDIYLIFRGKPSFSFRFDKFSFKEKLSKAVSKTRS